MEYGVRLIFTHTFRSVSSRFTCNNSDLYSRLLLMRKAIFICFPSILLVKFVLFSNGVLECGPNLEKRTIAGLQLRKKTSAQPLVPLQKLYRAHNTCSEGSPVRFCRCFRVIVLLRVIGSIIAHHSSNPPLGCHRGARPWLCARKFGPTRLESILIPDFQKMPEDSQVVPAAGAVVCLTCLPPALCLCC